MENKWSIWEVLLKHSQLAKKPAALNFEPLTVLFGEKTCIMYLGCAKNASCGVACCQTEKMKTSCQDNII